jgi:hypothetical protein
MEYVYMQQPKPTNATGVPVQLEVVDANGNYRAIGTAMSDVNGVFSYTWTPDIEGTYQVIARFDGTKSYWPSNAETSFVVDLVAPTPSSAPATTQAPIEMYIFAGVAAIIATIVIGFAVTIMTLRKRP